ncbi:hypothetical protein ADL15_04865 [Actinoplanes awajinensis subsp. mycoplanecinus]|uniref:Uncharacterized protein n=1 Tax=Actinoplanes awajinensis subsp. mycoplanecinus TaxID=135947 RepID=A0A0X3V9Q6_9ACTN|nr:hypothetical protein ADL15_04865 [Actinoplanes awajinensis subsp. mycoplanecinus]
MHRTKKRHRPILVILGFPPRKPQQQCERQLVELRQSVIAHPLESAFPDHSQPPVGTDTFGYLHQDSWPRPYTIS